MTGTLWSLMHDEDSMELEVRCQLHDAMAFLIADKRCSTNDIENKPIVPSFELHVGVEDVESFEVPMGFTVHGVRVFDIDYAAAPPMCTMILQLK